MIMIRFNERFCFSSWDSAAVLFVSGNGDSSFFSGCPFPITIGATNVISKAKKENRNRYICLIVVLKATFGDVAFDGLLHFGKLKIPVIDGIPDIPPGIRQQNPPDKLHNIRLQVHLVSLTLIFSKKIMHLSTSSEIRYTPKYYRLPRWLCPFLKKENAHNFDRRQHYVVRHKVK